MLTQQAEVTAVLRSGWCSSHRHITNTRIGSPTGRFGAVSIIKPNYSRLGRISNKLYNYEILLTWRLSFMYRNFLIV
jgi:hypothetical protein